MHCAPCFQTALCCQGHISPLSWAPRTSRRAGRARAQVLGDRFISPRKGTSVHSTTCSPRKGKREPAPGEFGGPAGESRVQVLSWLLTVQGCARAENGPGCLQTLPARAGLVPLLQLLQLSSQQVRAACSVLPCQDQTSP